MLRLRPLPPRRARRPAVPRVLDTAFAGALVLAFSLGGTTAWAGLPNFTHMLFTWDAAVTRGAPVNIALSPAGYGLSERQSALHRRPAIAIVIDDLGRERASTARALALPRAVAMSFLPYFDETPALAGAANRRGHEVLVHVPMESISGRNPSPMVLTTDLSSDEIVRRLNWAMARVPGFVGINNHEGSKFTSSREALVPVMQAVAQRGVFFFDSRTAPTSKAVSVAQAHHVTTAARDVFLDDTVSRQEVARRLRELERLAQSGGVAIAIGHPHPETLEVLEVWTKNIEARGFDLVPLREAIRLKNVREQALASR